MAPWRQRAVGLVALVVLVVAFVVGGQYLSLAAPFAGDVFATADGPGGGEIENPYGHAEVRFDEAGVPHVTADNERALYFAVGYVQARDRLFQMDLQRRVMNGTLSEVAGNATVESDLFHRRMGFRRAAEATWDRLEGSDHGAKVEAFSAGVNRYVETRPLPMEFRLNDYEPREWTPVATLLVGQQISWQLSGGFDDLEAATVERNLPEATSLFPRRLDHDAPIVDDGRDGQSWSPPEKATGSSEAAAVDAIYESVRRFEGNGGLGSNNWAVAGEHTAGGSPLLANDPHLRLQAPPVWYEMHLRAGDLEARGVTFPGIPFVILGTNREVSWGVTNVGADVTDAYTYEWRDGRYRYDGEWRTPETTTRTITVDGDEDRTVTFNRTVHGPLLTRKGQRVAVAWTGLTAQNQSLAIDRLGHASSLDDVRRALRDFHVPAQNFVAADRDGTDILYYPAGKYPIRRVDGEAVAADRVFNGSAGHGEWAGFTPYGQSSWEGFVPFEKIPHLDDPAYVGNGNQRVVDDPGFYMGTSRDFASPYRGQRIYALLERRIESDQPVTAEYLQRMQRDTHSLAAEGFTPILLAATDEMPDEAAELVREADLGSWDHEMVPDSGAALVFSRWLEHYRNETFADEFYGNGLDSSYYPKYWTLEQLPADSEWFDDVRTGRTEDRDDVAARAMAAAADEIDSAGWETYGDYNTADLDHPFPVSFLDYPEKPIAGSPFTISNVRARRDGTPAGSSWRLVAGADSAVGIIPGGNSGRYFSPHYADQFDRWRTGEYKPLSVAVDGRPRIVFADGTADGGGD
jgi:penicillin amidase